MGTICHISSPSTGAVANRKGIAVNQHRATFLPTTEAKVVSDAEFIFGYKLWVNGPGSAR